jgi:hypothetical protein
MERRNSRASETEPTRGEALDFLDLITRLPVAARPFLLMEEKARLESELAKITELLEGVVVQSD